MGSIVFAFLILQEFDLNTVIALDFSLAFCWRRAGLFNYSLRVTEISLYSTKIKKCHLKFNQNSSKTLLTLSPTLLRKLSSNRGNNPPPKKAYLGHGRKYCG